MICHLLISYSWSAISWEISFAVLKHPRWWCWWTIKKVGSFSAPLSQISLKAEKNDKYEVKAVWKSCVVPGRLALALVSLILQALLSARAAPHHHRCSFKNTKNDYLMYRIWYQPKYQFFPGSNFGSVFNFASLFFALLKAWAVQRIVKRNWRNSQKLEAAIDAYSLHYQGTKDFKTVLPYLWQAGQRHVVPGQWSEQSLSFSFGHVLSWADQKCSS